MFYLDLSEPAAEPDRAASLETRARAGKSRYWDPNLNENVLTVSLRSRRYELVFAL